MCTEYLTKWAETKAVKEIIEKKVAEFLREYIFYKFFFPRELVTNQGAQFISNLIKYLMREHHIMHMTSTSYHPQQNGQVEVTNRELENILTKVVRSRRKYWEYQIVDSTWAYNKT